MGSEQSKPQSSSTKSPRDPDPYSTELFTKSYPAQCTLNIFASHLNLLLLSDLESTEAMKMPENPHETQLLAAQNSFISRLFTGFLYLQEPAKAVPEQLKGVVLPKSAYIRGMKLLLANNCENRLNFLLSLFDKYFFTSTSSDIPPESKLSYPTLQQLFLEIIALYHQLHTFEEAKIAEYKYCVAEEVEQAQAEASLASHYVEPAAIHVEDLKKQKKKDEEAAAQRAIEDEKRAIEDEQKTKQEAEKEQSTTSSRYNMGFSVPKDYADEPVATKQDIEESILEELENMRLKEISRSKKLANLSSEVIRSLVLTLFQYCNQDLSNLSEEDRQAKALPTSRVKSWILTQVPSMSDVLQTLVRLNITETLSDTAPDATKKLYKRVAPLPDGVNMERSKIWSAACSWTFHHFFDLSNVGSWKLLYSSHTHGHSFNRFIHRVVGYKSESLMLIQTKQGEVFGAYLDEPWQVGSNYFGSNDCFLFGLVPHLAVRRVQPTGPKNYAYFFTNKKSYSSKPVGIGFGGTPGHFRLDLDEDMLNGTVRTMDPSFESGPISLNAVFEVTLIEVWASCSDYAEAGLLRERWLREKDAERARKAVDKNQAWNEGPDKFIMDLVGRTGASNGIAEQLIREREEKKNREQFLLQKAAEIRANKEKEKVQQMKP